MREVPNGLRDHGKSHNMQNSGRTSFRRRLSGPHRAPSCARCSFHVLDVVSRMDGDKSPGESLVTPARAATGEHDRVGRRKGERCVRAPTGAEYRQLLAPTAYPGRLHPPVVFGAQGATMVCDCATLWRQHRRGQATRQASSIRRGVDGMLPPLCELLAGDPHRLHLV